MCLKYKKIYIVTSPETDDDDSSQTSYWCSSICVRANVYMHLLMLDYGDRFTWWCNIHHYEPSSKTWLEFLSEQVPTDGYTFSTIKIRRKSPLIKQCMITRKIMRDISKAENTHDDNEKEVKKDGKD